MYAGDRCGYTDELGNASGFNWSCTPVTGDFTVRCLDFSTQGLHLSGVHYRAIGFQLRCLSE
ncbi:hypothetical protein [uncultured Rikenella sp.]|uniref:hypothetical protein n=1 Tax=uncultured Rikenella sp. TaxID=368003 RepID=UPI0026333CA5|nr:hypothetical protein [uncultured Rikenella sp.]